ncbi:MAG: hypothetical protein H6741_00780 [Alphaproteobacteria bacterium]|nr:hypothetical protein [Alphaproteobacteria bacterium]MCB9791236.1 hypothetical protein [Alphaproteobacteria bacterium]
MPELMQHVEWEEHLLSLDLTILLPAALAAGLALALCTWTTLSTAAWRGERSRSVLLITLALLGGAGPAALFALFPERDSSAWSQFPWAAGGAATCAALGLIAVFLANVEALERHLDERPIQWLLLPQGLLGALAAWLAVQAGLDLRRAGPLPGLYLASCEEVHVGVPCVPRVELLRLGVLQRRGLLDPTEVQVYFLDDPLESVGTSFADARGWFVPEQRIEADSPGTHRLELLARNGFMTVRHEVSYEAFEESWDPRFDPAVGSFWRLQRYDEVGGERVALFLRNPPRREDREPLEIRVLEEALLPVGLRARRVRVGAAERWLAGLGGRTWVVDPDTGARELAVQFSGEPLSLGDLFMGRARVAQDLQAERCELAFFPEWRCFCVDEPVDAARALPGVALCTDVDDLSRVGSTLVGVLTVGLVAPRPTQRVMILEASGVDDSPR